MIPTCYYNIRLYLFDVNTTSSEDLMTAINEFESKQLKYILVGNKVDEEDNLFHKKYLDLEKVERVKELFDSVIRFLSEESPDIKFPVTIKLSEDEEGYSWIAIAEIFEDEND